MQGIILGILGFSKKLKFYEILFIDVPPKVSPKISKLVGISFICQCQNPHKYDIVDF